MYIYITCIIKKYLKFTNEEGILNNCSLKLIRTRKNPKIRQLS